MWCESLGKQRQRKPINYIASQSSNIIEELRRHDFKLCSLSASALNVIARNNKVQLPWHKGIDNNEETVKQIGPGEPFIGSTPSCCLTKNNTTKL